MTNVDALRKIINDNNSFMSDSVEALEFIDAIEEEIIDLKDERATLRTEVVDRESEIRSLQDQPETTAVFLGLDTLHYRLESGNLRITQQLENLLNNIKHQNAAGILLPE